MNTVDALNVLGKALCGDSFEVKPGLTDAETILEIAKNYKAPEGGGSGGGLTYPVVNMTWVYDDQYNVTDFSVDKNWSELNAMRGGYIILHEHVTYIDDGVEKEDDTYDVANIDIWGTSNGLYFYKLPRVSHSPTNYVLNIPWISVSEGSDGVVEFSNTGTNTLNL